MQSIRMFILVFVFIFRFCTELLDLISYIVIFLRFKVGTARVCFLKGQSQGRANQEPVWKGRPAVGLYIVIYGIICLIILSILVTLEWWLSITTSLGASLFPFSLVV